MSIEKNKPQFSVGEIVRVKRADGILRSIDATNKTDGCFFMDQMWNYCGKTYPILKIVDYFFSEYQKRTFKPRSTLYLLQNVICEGKIDNFIFSCDRNCFLIWHEAWLEENL
jgi:hypothetical protein